MDLALRDLERDIVERDDVGLPFLALEDARDRVDLDRCRAHAAGLPAHRAKCIAAVRRCTDSVKPCKEPPRLRLASIGVVLRKLLTKQFLVGLLALTVAGPALRRSE